MQLDEEFNYRQKPTHHVNLVQSFPVFFRDVDPGSRLDSLLHQARPNSEVAFDMFFRKLRQLVGILQNTNKFV